MTIISINKASEFANLGDFIAEIIKDPKAWKKASDEIRAAESIIEEAAKASSELNKLEKLTADLEIKKAEAENASSKAKVNLDNLNQKKMEINEAEKAVKQQAASILEREEVVKLKEINIQKSLDDLKKEQEEVKTLKVGIKIKQEELDALIAKYKEAVLKLESVSV